MPTLTTGSGYGQAWPPRNDSGIGHNLAKLSSEPAFDFHEVDGYKETFTDSDTEATRVFDVRWSQRLAWKDFVLGFSVVVPSDAQDDSEGVPPLGAVLVNNQPSWRIARSIPWQHPEMPWLYARRVELMQGLGAIGDRNDAFAVDGNNTLVAGGGAGPGGAVPLRMIRYVDNSNGQDGFGRYAVNYGVLPYQVVDDTVLSSQFQGNELARYVDRKFKFAAQNLPLPVTTPPRFTAGPLAGQPVPTSGAILITGTKTITWIWMQLPDIPHDALDNTIGKVNLTAFDGLGGFPSYAAQTLLMQAPIVERYRGPTGRIHWRLEVNAIFRKQTWNSFPASDGQFYPIANADGSLVYTPVEFASVFRATAPPTYQ